MRAVVAGDGQAMERLYGLTANALFTYLRRLGSGAADADDVLQTTFLNAWRSRARFQGEGVRAWLFTIARNAYFTHASKQAIASVDPTSSVRPDTPAQHFAATDLSRRIEAALSELPDDTREAVVLSRISGLSIRQIAALLDTSEGNVRVRIHRGLARLKEGLEL